MNDIIMKDYQERVLIEQKELSEKISKLTTFVINLDTISSIYRTDQNLLFDQLIKMLEYNRILQMRLEEFNIEMLARGLK